MYRIICIVFMLTLVSCATTSIPLPSNTCKKFQGVWQGETTFKCELRSGRVPGTFTFGDNCRYIYSDETFQGKGEIYTDDSGRIIYKSLVGDSHGLVVYKTEGQKQTMVLQNVFSGNCYRGIFTKVD